MSTRDTPHKELKDESERRIIAPPFGEPLIAIVVQKAIFFPGTQDSVNVPPHTAERVGEERFALMVFPNQKTDITSGVATLAQLENITPVELEGEKYFNLKFNFICRVKISNPRPIPDSQGRETIIELTWELLEEEELPVASWKQKDTKEQLATLEKMVNEILTWAPNALEQHSLTILKTKRVIDHELIKTEKLIGGLAAVLEFVKHPQRGLFGQTLDITTYALFELYYTLKEDKPTKNALKLISNVFHTFTIQERLRRLLKFTEWFIDNFEPILDDEEKDEEEETESSVTKSDDKTSPAALALLRRYQSVKSRIPDEVREEMEREFARLKQGGHPGEAEAAKNHLDWLLRLFSLEDTQDNQGLSEARRILDEDHWGLEKVKEQILEFLAVRKHVPSGSGDILCFVGPPGIGKTSLGKSIARALRRKFTRLSLGGVSDVGEIRGHDLVYARTHPGKIVQQIVRSGSSNPVFVLDEIDKVGEHWRGDPAAALLAVLDPEQNIEFLDTFINVHFDLSHVFFICTANSVNAIHRPLRDRMETILLPGYTQLEKLAIAQKYLVAKERGKQGFPLQREGLEPLNMVLSNGAPRKLIEEYTREAGVRQIEREIRRIYRRVARRAEEGEFRDTNEIGITAQNLHLFAGKPRVYPEQRFNNMPIGCVPMFAVSDDGGHFFYVEVMMERGRSQRKIKVTGVRGSGESKERINNLIEESFDVAFDGLMLEGGIFHEPPEDRQKRGEFYIHVHIRDGATPKDGPSAGIPARAAAFSLMANTPIQPYVGATGEIDLRLGMLEPIGGLKEKALAAHRAGIKRFVIPKDNERDIDEVPPEIKSEVEFIPCRSVWRALLEFFPNNELILKHIEGKEEWSS